MAIKKDYTTEAELEKFLNISITANEADDIINSAIDLVDNLTGRNFVADTVASAKYYNGNSKNELFIDDCVEVTEVSVGLDAYYDSSEVVANGGYNGYYLLPENNVEDGGGDYPVQKIHLRSRYFIRGIKNQKITAKWGFSVACPDDIRLATTIIAGGIWANNHLAGTGEIASERIGNYSVSYDVGTGAGSWSDYKSALRILDNYKRINL